MREKESKENLLSRKHAEFIYTILWLTNLFHTHICAEKYIGMYSIIPFPHTNISELCHLDQIVISRLYGYGSIFTVVNILHVHMRRLALYQDIANVWLQKQIMLALLIIQYVPLCYFNFGIMPLRFPPKWKLWFNGDVVIFKYLCQYTEQSFYNLS